MNSAGDMESTTTKADHQKSKNLIRSQYKDVMVKVDEDIYFLDRFCLALKSEYFDNLFSNDFSDKYCNLIEIPVMDSDTFSAIVDIIYGAELDSVINSENYISLLIAMDYLQMKVDLESYRFHILKMCEKGPHGRVLNPDIPRLCQYITLSGNFQNLLPTIYECISRYFKNIREQDLDKFLSLSFDHFVQICLSCLHSKINQRAFSKFCAKWICHDLDNRLSHMIDLVNAAKVRFGIPNEIHGDDFSVRLSTINEHTLSRYFYKLLMYAGETTAPTSISTTMEREYKSTDDYQESKYVKVKKDSNSSDEESDDESRYSYSLELQPVFESKMKTFLNNGNYYDITVKVGGKSYKLHRFVLKSASGYFEDIFSVEYSEAVAQCEGMPALPSKDKVYSIDEIDQTTFDFIINYIYLDKADITSDIVVRLFIAADILKINGLLKRCKEWFKLKSNTKKVSAQNVKQMLTYAHEIIHHKDLNEVNLSKYFDDCWSEIDNFSQFAGIFKEFTERGGITDQPDEKKGSLLNRTDRETFALIVNHIRHFNKAETKFYVDAKNVAEVLKASEIFHMKDVMEQCIEWLENLNRPKLPEDFNLNEVLRFTSKGIEYEDLNRIYFVKYLTRWPQVDNLLFCSISQDLLEDVLMSPDFFLNNPHEILDMCSKWIIYDVENRFGLIPEIALAISRNRSVNCDDHVVTNPPDLGLVTEDFVKEKLWQILSSTSVLPSEILSTNKKKKAKTEPPVFIKMTENRTLEILDSDMNVIESLHLSKWINRWLGCFMSATRVNNNIFILLNSGGSGSEKTIFHAYNYSLKKTFFLTSDSRMLKYGKKDANKFTLLNCNNEIYCCFNDGAILKYVFELNRWMKVSESDPNTCKMCFTSAGDVLYRIRTMEKYDSTRNILESYNFDQNVWNTLPDAPALRLSMYDDFSYGYDDFSSRFGSYHSVQYPMLSNLIVVNNYNLAVLCDDRTLILFNRRLQTWTIINTKPFSPLCRDRNSSSSHFKDHSAITPDKAGGILYVLNDKLYRKYFPGQRWELKKSSAIKETWRNRNRDLPHKNIIAIHDI